ncbi:hypothetical protein M407DRAFT_195836 [Tulasnella calospora MUT 4182]|uniref:Uncharacterized protein n=1 Tax=Tulasnella calospora MUT 4182 TaxID=1051891 RepID=A0A0C3Q9Y7_9AGAM|nr:hypothetical protein M407DRAFT_195836 [Tulasnella calospora MUT 4182]
MLLFTAPKLHRKIRRGGTGRDQQWSLTLAGLLRMLRARASRTDVIRPPQLKRLKIRHYNENQVAGRSLKVEVEELIQRIEASLSVHLAFDRLRECS